MKSAAAYFQSHLIGIRIFCEKQDFKAQNQVYSAFIMSVADNWFLVTAGHCIEEIKDASKFKWDNFQIQLLDAFSAQAETRVPVPYPRHLLEHSFHYDQDGYDVGVMSITENIRQMLEANEVEPIDEKIWNGRAPINSPNTEYWMIGIPEEAVCYYTKSGDLSAGSFFIKLERHSTWCGNLAAKLGQSFFGKLDTQVVKSVVGMSGSPIFAVSRNSDGSSRYWLTAIQSAWDSDARCVAGCDPRGLGMELQDIITARQI